MVSKAAVALRGLLKPTPPPMNQEALADAVGVTQQAVSQWLRGVTKPGYKARVKLAEILGVPADEWDVEADSANDTGPRTAVDAMAADEALKTG